MDKIKLLGILLMVVGGGVLVTYSFYSLYNSEEVYLIFKISIFLIIIGFSIILGYKIVEAKEDEVELE